MSWENVPLGKICEIVSGATPRRNVPEYWGGDIAWATPKDISGIEGAILSNTPEYISKAGYKSCSARLLPKDSILFSSRAPIGSVAIAGREMCTNQGFKSLIPGPDVDSTYLYYCMNKYANRIAALGSGATFKEVSKEKVSNFPIPLPPLKEQKRIAAILDKADAIRRKRRQAIQLAGEFLRSVFLDMFGDPVLNPKGWKEARLDQISEIVSGVTKGRKLNSKVTVIVPYMRVANVQDGRILIDDVQGIEVFESEIKKYRLKQGDILLTEGGDPDKLGRGAVWKGEIDPCIHQNHIFRVRSNTKIILPEYLSALIGSQRGKRYFLKAAKQTTGVASINKTQLSGFPALTPPIDNQYEYLNRLERFDHMFDTQMRNYKESDKLFKSLAQRGFRGEL